MTFTACGDDDSAKKCDAQKPCSNGMVCVDDKCVTTECGLTQRCADADKICSDLGLCVAKTDKLECSTMHLCANAYSCDHGVCANGVVDKSCNKDKNDLVVTGMA